MQILLVVHAACAILRGKKSLSFWVDYEVKLTTTYVTVSLRIHCYCSFFRYYKILAEHYAQVGEYQVCVLP